MGRSKPFKVNNFILCEGSPNMLHWKFYIFLGFPSFSVMFKLSNMLMLIL